ncbi:ABC transporter permease [Peribacillus cavernae]|uniref:Cell division protein FtsX n=1 Tax=Peribacillus cavernae TaxID=1674310 RepID=A0A433HSV3_9BACI|nr:permease-like cell division protein FtsX [Peribacillus cavernae]MDQ0218384.1 cell division transport system permease protein [Peribacillus cavernae]RUQ31392.1 ABC transporter permease [Peribacillus cavernae]
MKFNTLRRHFRESGKNLGRNGWMTFASISAVTVTLLLVGVFFVIMMNLNHIAGNVEKDVEIRAHVDSAANDQDREMIGRKIEQIPEVDTSRFSPKEKELTNLIQDLGEDGDAFKLFEQDNPLRDVYIIKTKNPQDVIKVAKEVEGLNYIQKVNYGQGYVEKLFDVVNVARNIGIILILGLLFTAMFLISNTIKITIVARRKEIEIMRLVGATNSFIRWPFFLEGLWLGMLGAVLPIILIGTGYYYLYETVSPRIDIKFVELLSVNPFIIQVSAILLLLGALIGVWGSMMTVRKFLKI